MKYRIMVYKLYTLDYVVEAENVIEALSKHERDLSKPDLESLKYWEDANEYGMSTEELSEAYPELSEETRPPFLNKYSDYLEAIGKVEVEE